MVFGFFDFEQSSARESFGTFFGGLSKPTLRRKKRFRRSAVGQDFEPTLDTPCVCYAPYFDGIRRKFCGLEGERHQSLVAI